MKKLLALILCVMMFVAVIPTSAFADSVQPFPTSSATKTFQNTAVANTVITNAKKNIDYIYNALAADNAVFGTVKTMDDVVVDLAKGLFADLPDGMSFTTYVNGVKGKTYISQDTLEKNAKRILRNAMGYEVADYMNKHVGSYASVSTHFEDTTGKKLVSAGVSNVNGYALYHVGNTWYGVKNGKVYDVNTSGLDTTKSIAEQAEWLSTGGDGRFTLNTTAKTVQDFRYDPIKYANAFATAVNNAFTGEKGSKNIQAVMYGLMEAKVKEDVRQKMDDLYDDMKEWEDGNAILAAYGFHEFFNGDIDTDPYILIDYNNTPKASTVPAGFLNPDTTSYWLAD